MVNGANISNPQANRKKKLKKSLSIPKLKKKAWALYSAQRRQKAADFGGYVKCYTCPKVMHWKESHLGHYQHNKIDFHPNNTRIQCPGCNTYRGGMLDTYTLNLIAEIGLEAVQEIKILAARFKGYSRAELNEYLEMFKNGNV